MQVLYLQSEQVNSAHNLEDIHIQSSTSTAAVHRRSEQQVKRYQIYAAATADFCLRIYYTALIHTETGW